MTRQRALELSATTATLLGQFLGSTTLHGALAYAVATVLWVWLTIECKLWGIMPLNIVGGVITARVLVNFCLS
jgi:hypothetical protein